MADEAIEASAVQDLRRLDGNIGAETFAEGEDGGPANDEAGDHDEQRGDHQPRRVAEHIVRRVPADPPADGERGNDYDPEKQKRAAIANISGAAFGAGGDADDDFGGGPGPIEDLPE